MKKYFLTHIFIGLIVIIGHGQGIAPSINKEWTAHAYEELSTYLDELSPSDYPTISPNDKLLKKAINSIAQPILQNKDFALDLRMQQAITLQTAVNHILMKYNNAYVAGTDYSAELSYLLGLSLSVSKQVIAVVNEFIQTLDPNDEKYSVQIEGLKMMRNGTATQMDGALITLGESKAFTDKERNVMSKYFAENAFEIVNFLEEDYRFEFVAKLKRHISTETNEEIKEVLIALLTKFKM